MLMLFLMTLGTAGNAANPVPALRRWRRRKRLQRKSCRAAPARMTSRCAWSFRRWKGSRNPRAFLLRERGGGPCQSASRAHHPSPITHHAAPV